MPVSARVAHHWISDINANSCNEFRMTLHLGLLRGEVLVVPNWYFCYSKRTASHKTRHAHRVTVSSSGLIIHWKQSL